jgi:hypothetical protein
MTVRTFTFTVAAPQSYINTLAATTTSGTFSSNFGSAAGINTALNHQGGTGSGPPAFNGPNSVSTAYTLLDWTGKAHFDATNDEWWYSAGTTGEDSGSMTMIRYSVASNNFRHWQGALYTDTGIFGYGQAHNFEAAAFDPTRRKIYRLLNASGGSARRIGVFDVDTKTGTSWATAVSASYYGMEALPEASALCVFYYDSNSTTIQRYSMDTGAQLSSWTKPASVNKNALCYYSGKIYFTGDSLGFYSIDSTGAVATLANTPVQMHANGQGLSIGGESPVTGHTILGHLGDGYIYAFRLSPGGQGVYRYNTATNAWSANLTTTYPTLRTQKWVVGPIRSEGVFLLITSPSADDVSACHIWKP